MATALWSVVLLLHVPSPAGYLAPSSAAAEAVPYVPREGDLIFFDDHGLVWTALFSLAGSGPPLHMGIVVKKSDGTPAILEAGPDDSVWVQLQSAGPRLRQFHKDYKGTVTVRRCKKTLTAKQSAALTKFAEAQNGKRYAVGQLLLQGTPFRVRGPLEPLLGKTDLNCDAWICSQLAVAAGTAAGLFNPKVVRANVVYPRDLVDNETYDLRATWHDAAEWQPDAACRGARRAQE
jgi:hypothetical protein